MPQIPLQISFHNVDHSAAVEADIRKKAEHLERFSGRMTSCRVVVEATNRTQHKGRLYNCTIDITLPGREIAVGRVGPKNHAHEDIYVAVRDAFNAAGRRLEDHTRRARLDVKTHEAPVHGKVLRLDPEGDYGFIELSDGQELYFHRNSVTDGSFSKLEPGCEVRVVVAEGESAHGAQASSVTPIGKHHIVE